MVSLSLEELERLRVCPILHEQKKDYSPTPTGQHALLKFAINDIYKWYGRRGYAITDSTVISSISNFAFTKGIDRVVSAQTEHQILKLMKSIYYQNIDRPIVNQDITYNFPNNKKIAFKCDSFFFYRNHYYLVVPTERPIDLMFMTRDLYTRLSLYWIARTFQNEPYVLNLYPQNEELVAKRIKVNSEFMVDVEEELKRLKRVVDNPFGKIIPCMKVCMGCNWRKECLTIQKQKLSSFAKQIKTEEEPNKSNG